jgi:glycosyltransferase involved in cell wall biosynthesis
VVVGWYQSLFECLEAPSPLVYFEQGHEMLYGDVPDSDRGREAAAQFEAAMRLPVPVAGVSQHVADTLRARFGRSAAVWPNGIDLERFRPDGHPPGRRVLLVGNAYLPFKGFQVALEALQRAFHQGPPFEVTWVSQAAVQVEKAPFRITNLVSPPQDRLPGIYREHDLLLFTSRYESFPLPPIEAMASGVPVVATQCGGIATYARAGHDAVLCPVADVASLATAVSRLLASPDTLRLLSARGRATAERFTWDAACQAVESSLLRVAASPRPPHH